MDYKLMDKIISELGVISTMASLENASNTKKLTNSVINHLRYKNSRQNQIIKLGEEIRCINEFKYVQEIRYENLLNCHVYIEKECETIYIPHYAIMTFVENAFYHAFQSKECDWNIEIKCIENGGFILVKIKDNGIGFSSKSYLNQNNINSSEYGSITSTYIRLINHYKFNDILKIESDNISGTTVTLNLPKL